MSILQYKYRENVEFTIEFEYIKKAQREIELHLLDNFAVRVEFSENGLEISTIDGLEDFTDTILLRFKYSNNGSDIEEIIDSLIRVQQEKEG